METLRLLIYIGCRLLLLAKSYKRDVLRLLIRGSFGEAGLARAEPVVPNLSQAHPVQQTVETGPMGRKKSSLHHQAHFHLDDLKVATSVGEIIESPPNPEYSSMKIMTPLSVATQIRNPSEAF